jgi:hypothetical protein
MLNQSMAMMIGTMTVAQVILVAVLSVIFPEDGSSRFPQNIGVYQITWCHNPEDHSHGL